MVDINRGRSVPLGRVQSLPVTIGNSTFKIDALVTDSKDYNLLLENKFISPKQSKLDYKNRKFSFETRSGIETVPLSYWQKLESTEKVERIIPTVIPEDDKIEYEDDEFEEQKTYHQMLEEKLNEEFALPQLSNETTRNVKTGDITPKQ